MFHFLGAQTNILLWSPFTVIYFYQTFLCVEQCSSSYSNYGIRNVLVLHAAVRNLFAVLNYSNTRGWIIKAAYQVFTPSPVDLELNRDFNGDDYEYEDEAKLVIFPDHFEIPLPNIEELPALVSELLLHGSLCLFCWGFFALAC